MQLIRQRIFLIAFLLLGLAWIVVSRAAPGSTTSGLVPAPQAGFLAPDFTLQTIDGRAVKLSDLRGQVVIVNFWASWCPPCKAEMPAIQHVYDAYRNQGLVVLAVNATNQDTLANAQAFLSENNLTFPVPLDVNGETTRLYKINSFPTTFFITPDGVIHEVVIGGPMTEAALRLRVEKLLEGLR
jgi:cytochrome c biogenesis protein CcmG, thiol:disulfide interchange protein DsbE